MTLLEYLQCYANSMKYIDDNTYRAGELIKCYKCKLSKNKDTCKYYEIKQIKKNVFYRLHK